MLFKGGLNTRCSDQEYHNHSILIFLLTLYLSVVACKKEIPRTDMRGIPKQADRKRFGQPVTSVGNYTEPLSAAQPAICVFLPKGGLNMHPP